MFSKIIPTVPAQPEGFPFPDISAETARKFNGYFNEWKLIVSSAEKECFLNFVKAEVDSQTKPDGKIARIRFTDEYPQAIFLKYSEELKRMYPISISFGGAYINDNYCNIQYSRGYESSEDDDTGVAKMFEE
jgi:hypothetical protein